MCRSRVWCSTRSGFTGRTSEALALTGDLNQLAALTPIAQIQQASSWATMWPNSLENQTMSANAVVRARIDEHIKEEATVVLAAMGLTISDAFRMMLTRVAQEKALPFEPLVPNATTLNAMKEARQGNLKSFDSVEDLMADLNAED